MDLVRRQRHLPARRRDLAAAAERVPDDRLLVETDAPYLTPQAVRKERNQPAFVAHTARFVAERRGVGLRRARRARRAQRRPALRLVTGDLPTPAEPAPAARSSACAPSATSGQNFLIDSNILGVIERAAELTPDDVVLEIGGGLGVLSEHLAPRAPHVHVVELDRALEPALRDALEPFANTTLHLADAMTLDLAALRPGADEGRRQPALRHRRQGDPAHDRGAAGVTRWVAMVQKEVGERFAAAPGRRAYGVPSVLAQLACDVRVQRSVVAHRLPPGAQRRLGARRAAAHRARAGARAARARPGAPSRTGARRWPRSLPLAPGRRRRRARPRARRAGRARPARRRARRAPVAGGVPRARARPWALSALRERRPAKINLCLFLGPTRADGRHELVVGDAVGVAGRRAAARARRRRRRDEVVCPGVEGDNLAAAALRRLPRAHRLGGRRRCA